LSLSNMAMSASITFPPPASWFRRDLRDMNVLVCWPAQCFDDAANTSVATQSSSAAAWQVPSPRAALFRPNVSARVFSHALRSFVDQRLANRRTASV
jgi:hypothetical protein